MRIALVNLPWREENFIGVRAGSRWPFKSHPAEDGKIHYVPFPFFLTYSTALLKKNCEKALFIDSIAESINIDELILRLISYNCNFLVVETSTPSFLSDISILERISVKIHDLSIALCGPHASVFPEKILKEHSFINYIFVGEYEFTLLELAKALENKSSLKGINGLVYRDNELVVLNKIRPTISCLDDLPWPDRNESVIYRYNDGFANLPQPNVQMLASRGCPFFCNFCLWPQTIYFEHRYRKRNYLDVIDEMEYLVKKFAFKAIYFDDDVFNVDRKYVLSICREKIHRGITTPWAIMARADLMDEEILNTLFMSGLWAVKYGIESADKNILKNCKKNMDLDKVIKNIAITKKVGIKVHLTFCLGLPGETYQSVYKTIKFIESVKPDSFQFSFATPFPGTDFFKYLSEKSWLQANTWSDYDGNNHCVCRTEELSQGNLEKIKSFVQLRLSQKNK